MAPEASSILSWVACICCGLCGRSGDGQDDGAAGLTTPLLDGSTTAPEQQSAPRHPKPVNTNNMLGLGSRDVNEDYEFGDLLGQGAFGVVRRCINKRTRGAFACKTVHKSQLRRRADVEDVRREVSILMMLSSHPNVAALLAIYEDTEAVHMILELCEGGQLFDEICAQGGLYSERAAARHFRKLVEVVHHCHTLGIAHRDIKPENFLLSVGGPDGEVKAADFGLSQFFRPGKNFHSLVGSAYYVAPEVLKRDYGPKADIWSLGVCLYILLSGLAPFWGETEEDIFAMVLHADVDYDSEPWTILSRPARDIVRRMLDRDPSRRPTAQQLLQHSWLCQAAPDRPLGSTVVARMKAFADMTKVRRVAMLVATQSLAEERAGQIQAAFKALDVDETGSLSADEIRVGLARLGVTVDDGELEGLMQGAALTAQDRVPSGSLSETGVSVSLPAFMAATLGHSAAQRDDFATALFARFDEGGSGRVLAGHLRAELCRGGVTEAEVEKVLEAMGSDQGGWVTVERFKRWLGHHAGSLQEAVRRNYREGEVQSTLGTITEAGEETPEPEVAAQAGGEGVQ